MNEKDIRAALEAIEPPDGAQERMYRNIRRKAAAPKQRPPVWRRYAALAACLVLICTAGFFAFRTPGTEAPPSGSDGLEAALPPMMGASPYEDVSGPEAFAPLGFTIDAPEGASDVTYCIAYGDTALVDFTLNGCAYRYEASAAEIFSEDAAETPALSGTDAVWAKAGVQYRLHTSGDAAAQTLLQLAEQLSETE